jgi:hypothetical protein
MVQVNVLCYWLKKWLGVDVKHICIYIVIEFENVLYFEMACWRMWQYAPIYVHVLYCLSLILSFCGPIRTVKLRYHCIPLFYKWTFFICNIHFSAVQFYMMSLLANYKAKLKVVMVNMQFCFQVRHPCWI